MKRHLNAVSIESEEPTNFVALQLQRSCAIFHYGATRTLVAIMAAHFLAIAKASLSVAMMRPDPNPVPRADVANFHALFEGLVSKCTPANVQV